jgi:hypothetical protein
LFSVNLTEDELLTFLEEDSDLDLDKNDQEEELLEISVVNQKSDIAKEIECSPPATTAFASRQRNSKNSENFQESRNPS